MDAQPKITPNLKTIITTLLAFTGAGRIWLWHQGQINDTALYIGLILIAGAAIMLWGIIKGRNS
jgi:hypothetical protein